MSKTRSARVLSPLTKLKRFLLIFAHNKRGLAGVIIIAGFAIIALGAPLFTRYDPVADQFVGGAYSAPLWVKSLPQAIGGNPGAAENFNVTDNANFTDLSGWNYSTTGGVAIDYSSDVSLYPGTGSLRVFYARNETDKSVNASANIYKEFYFPFAGNPRKFIAEIATLTIGDSFNYSAVIGYNFTSRTKIYGNGTSLYVNANVYMYLERVSDGKVTLIWPYQPQNGDGLDLIGPDGIRVKVGTKPLPGLINGTVDHWLDSNDAQCDSDIISSSAPNYDILPLIFAKPDATGLYRLGYNITFTDPVQSVINLAPPDHPPVVNLTIYVDRFDMIMQGRVFGILGTNHYGQDLWSQLLYGARISLYVGLLASVIGVVLGLIVGLAAGYMGRLVDEALMRFSDMLLVIPTLPLLIVLIAVLGPALENLILLIGFLGWMGFARVVRSQVLSLKERPFVEAARAVGAGRVHVMTKHIFPNVVSLVYVTLATSVPGAIVAEAALSFLGFYDPNKVSWGRMLYDVQAQGAAQYWWWVIPPGVCIALLAIAFVLLGFALDEVFNPKLRMRK